MPLTASSISLGDIVIGTHLVLNTTGNLTVGQITAAANSGFDVV